MAADAGEKNIHIEMPEGARHIIDILGKNGHEAYIVGGCVRDSIIGVTPGDWDITTSARPEEIKACFNRTVDTGIEHGTVTVLLKDGSYEVTTYRIDGEYRDLRHPSEVRFTRALSEDLRRRDFTVNAMAYNDSSGLVDLHGGLNDLNEKIVRCVGMADDRFDEDALRILRAVRFAAQLGFEIEPETAEAVKRHAVNLSAVSRERVLTEISKLICSGHIEKIGEIFRLGLEQYIAPGFESIDINDLMELKYADIPPDADAGYKLRELARQADKFRAFDLSSSCGIANRYVRFALLTERMEGEKLRLMLKGLRFDNDTVKKSLTLNRHALTALPSDKYGIKSIMAGIDRELFKDLLRLKIVSCRTSFYRRCCAGEEIDKVLELYEEITENREPVYLNELAVNGNDIIKEGIASGPAIGQLLKVLLDEVHRDPEHNDREYLIKTAKVYISCQDLECREKRPSDTGKTSDCIH